MAHPPVQVPCTGLGVSKICHKVHLCLLQGDGKMCTGQWKPDPASTSLKSGKIAPAKGNQHRKLEKVGECGNGCFGAEGEWISGQNRPQDGGISLGDLGNILTPLSQALWCYIGLLENSYTWHFRPHTACSHTSHTFYTFIIFISFCSQTFWRCLVILGSLTL